MDVKQGFKSSAVGPIPIDWVTKPCSAISDFITVGIVVRPAQYYVRQGVPALRSANIREGRIDENDMVFISEKANRLLSKSQVGTGDVLTVRTGYPGTSAVVPPHLAGSNCIDLLITRTSSRAVSSQYLAAWINSPLGKNQVLRNQGGLAQQHFNVRELRNLVVALPLISSEQEAIAEALSDADALIESLEQLLAKKRQIKQGAMQELLTGKRRLPGFVVKPGYKQTDVGVVPEDWKLVPMADLFSFQNGVNADKSAYGRGVPFINVLEVITHSTITEDRIPGRITLAPHAINAFAVRRGDVLFNRTSETQDEVGLASVYVGNETVVFGGFVIRARPRGETIDPAFISYALRSPIVRSQIVARGQGAVRANIGQQELSRVLAVLPARAEQEAIGATLSDMDAEIAALEAKLVKTRELKKGMMQQLLTGKIRLV